MTNLHTAAVIWCIWIWIVCIPK